MSRPKYVSWRRQLHERREDSTLNKNLTYIIISTPYKLVIYGNAQTSNFSQRIIRTQRKREDRIISEMIMETIEGQK